MAMSIRNEALLWLRAKGVELEGEFRVSKLYTPEKSWTKSYAWWFEFPSGFVETAEDQFLNLLCRDSSEESNFYILKVPLSFIKKNRDRLGFRHTSDKFSFFLSADSSEKFIEKRGTGKIDFSNFEIVP